MGLFSSQTRRINREMMALAAPNILSNISLPLLGTVDTALMGRLSDVHIAAVGIAAMIFNFLYWNFGFLRMATTGFTAQFVGRTDLTGQVMQLGRAGLLALFFAMLLIVLQNFIGETSFVLMNVSGELLPLVREYFYIRIWDVPATLGLLVIMGWFFGMQNAIAPLFLTIFVNSINIGLSFYFVRALGWGAEGVAMGTLIAQYMGLLLGIGIIYFRYRYLFVHFKPALLKEFNNWIHFIRVNSDIFLRTLALTLVFAFFYAKSAEMGALLLAVNVILMHFVNWMSYGIDGFAYATESLVGKYKGKESETELDTTLTLAFWWAGFLAVLCSLAYWFFGPAFLRIFTDVEEVLIAAQPYLIVVTVLPLLGFWSYVWDGIYIGLTASVSMRNAMIASFICFFACWYLLADQSSNYWLWYCLMVFLVLRAILQYALFRIYKYQLR